MRCIYDQSVFTESCLKAISNEEFFASFKRDPFYSLLYQGYSFEEGAGFLQAIESDHPSLIAHFDAFRSSDAIGNPRTYDYGKHGIFSPTTLRHILIAGIIQEKMKDVGTEHIIQIGAEYGGLCKALHALSLWKSYTLVDLPEHLALARQVLEKQGISGVHYLTLDEIPVKGNYDLVISDYSFSEFARPLQKMCIERILFQARSGYLLGYPFLKHFGVDPFSPKELKALCLKKIFSLDMHLDEGERADYQLVWRNSSDFSSSSKI